VNVLGCCRPLWFGFVAIAALACAHSAAAQDAASAEPLPLPDGEIEAALAQDLPEEGVAPDVDVSAGEDMSAADVGTEPAAVPVAGSKIDVEEETPDLIDETDGAMVETAELSPRARINGSLGVAGRLYFDDAPFPAQEVDHLYGYAFGTLNIEYLISDHDRFEAELYGRVTHPDLSSYSLVDARELFYLHTADTWDFLLGTNTVAWGVTESRQLVDIINQRDFGGNLDDDENRLGQPMANLNLISTGLGTLSLYGLFGFREFDFPEARDRIRQSFLVSEGSARFEGDDWEQAVNFAARYTNSFTAFGGGLDVGLSYFHGLNREALLVPVAPGRVIPLYLMMDQVGLEAVYAYEGLQLKFEGLSRWENGDHFLASVSGFEYTLHDVFDGSADLGLLAEYLFDDRSSNHPNTPFDNDVFGGIRLTLNNVGTTRILAGVIANVEDKGSFGSLEIDHRLRDDLLLSVDARTFLDIPFSDPSGFLATESFAEVAIAKYF
jgi:hypothetical protein